MPKTKDLNQVEKKTEQNGLIKSHEKLSTGVSTTAWYIGGAIALVFFILYISTASKTHISYGDSDGLLAIAYRLGSGMPPGYGLYIFLLHFVINLPIPGTVAFKGNVLSALLHSGALLFIFVSVWHLLEYIQTNKSKALFVSKFTDKVFVSGLTIVYLGSNFLFWLYGSIAEKFSLTDFLTSVLIFGIIFLRTTEKNKQPKWLRLGIGLVYGLLLIHYPLAIVLLPMFGVLLWLERKTLFRSSLQLFGGMTGGIIVSIALLLWLNRFGSPVSWAFPETFSGVITHILQGTFEMTQGGSQDVSVANLKPFNVNTSLQSIPGYVLTLLNHIGFSGLILSLIGVLAVYRYFRTMASLLLAAIVPAALLLPLYLQWPQNFSNQAYVMRYYLLGYVFLGLAVGLGLWLVLIRLKKALGLIVSTKTGLQLFLGLVFFGLGVWRIVHTYPMVNLKDYTLPETFTRTILQSLPNNALLGCFNTTICYAVLYEQEVNHFRRDIIVIPESYQLVSRKLAQIPDLHGYPYDRKPFVMFDYLTWNIDKRPVFVTDLPQTYYETLGIDFGFTYYMPYGYYGQLSRKLPQQLPTVDYTFARQLKQINTNTSDLMKNAFKAQIARIHIFNAAMYMKMGFRDESRDELNMASDLLFQLPQVSHNEIETTRKNIESRDPVKNFMLGSETQSPEEILGYVDTHLDKGKLQTAYRGAVGSLAIDPLNEQGRIKLAEIYERLGDREYALIEYQNVLRYHPDNQEAAAKVKELQN